MGNLGFTILELLMALTMGSIIVLAISGVYVFTTRATQQNDAQAYLQRQASLIVDELTRQIRPATSLLITTCGPGAGMPNSLLVTQPDPTPGASPGNVVKYCFRGDAAGTGFWQDHYPPPTGATVDGSWNMLTGAPVTLTTVSVPTFAVNSKRATITFQLQYKIPESQGFQNMAFETTISKRN